MKVYTGLLAALFLMCGSLAMAQEQTSSKVVVIANVKNEDGVTTTITRVVDGAQAEAYVKSLESDLEGQEFTIKTTDSKDGVVQMADKVIIINRSTDKKDCTITNMSSDKTNHVFKMIERHTGESMNNIVVEPFFAQGGEWKHSVWTSDGGNTTKRAILGIYAEGESTAKGIVVTGLTSQSGAATAGIAQGDIIQTVDGKSTLSAGGLRSILSSYKPGDKVNVTYVHGNESRNTVVVLSESTDFNWTSGRIERDPCQVFIGVYTSTNMEGDGVDVNGIIGDTPAEVSGVQKGDIILEMDGVPVNTHNELLVERNKHKPGQEFTLTIQRNGTIIDIDARFKICPTDVRQEPVKEEIPQEVVVTEPAAIDAPTNTEMPKLNLEVFQAFPNPTTGLINMRFQADAVPTMVQITDVTGKVIHQENLNTFDGYYDRQIDLTGAVPGTLTLTVRQGKQVFSQSIILITRA